MTLKRSVIIVPVVLSIAVGLGLVLSTGHAAQGNRVEFRAIYQQTLWYDITADEGPGWTVDHGASPPRALINGEGVALDLVHAFDSVVYQGVHGQEQGTTTFKLNDTDSFVREFRDSFNESPGKEGMYTLNMAGQIVSGTGRFENATGSITENGTYLIWYEMQDDHLIVKGKYIGSVVASIDLAE